MLEGSEHIQPSLFEIAIEPHLSALRAYCNRLANSLDDGEDLFQSTLEKALRAYTDVSTWNKPLLFRIAKNTWIDSIRKKSVPEQPLIEEHMNSKYTSTDLDIREVFEVMAERLSTRQAVLLLMIDVFRFTAKETAIHLGSTEGAIKEALKRTRQRLTRMASEGRPRRQGRTEVLPHERMTQELMEIFIQAFRSGNVSRIYHSYKALRGSGLDISKVWRQESYIYFDFRDPNGHLLRISSTIG